MLKNLSLIGMPNLEELWITDGLEIGDEQGGVQYCFPMLTNLHIKRCPKLFVKPWLPPGLEELTFEESMNSCCPQVVRSPVRLHLRSRPPAARLWQFLY